MISLLLLAMSLAVWSLFFWAVNVDSTPVVLASSGVATRVAFFVGSLPHPAMSLQVAQAPLRPTAEAAPQAFRLEQNLQSKMIQGVPAGKQARSLTCEFQSAMDLAGFYGKSVSWEDIFIAVGHDPNGDPYVGFVGASFDDPPGQLWPAGYGVYAPPVAKGLRTLGLKAAGYENRSPEWLIQQIDAGRPVIIWATYDMAPSVVGGWYTQDHSKWIPGVPKEHTYTIIGYDTLGVTANDPYDGTRRHFTWADFLRSWAYLGQMAVVIED
jgi:uncharacterized protein YvpB